MAGKFEWRDEYCLGVKEIDREHQQLFRIVNKLFEYREQEKDRQWTCQEGIKYFKTHALKHFGEEEAYMVSIGYKGLEQHRRVHQNFRENILPALEQELEAEAYSPDAVDHFLGVCAGWLVGHTLSEDQAIAGKGARRWDSLLPEEEIKALKKVVTRMQFDMFHLEARIISDMYGGEKFGRGVYYHLIYGRKKDDKKYEVLLAFEETLLINTVGKILGIETTYLDSMLVHASRYTAQQFVGRVMKMFPSLDGYELKEDSLLTYEEFQQVFQKTAPQASMLFDTGAGYFSYCTIAPHLLEVGVGKPLLRENAASQVEEYLKEREESLQREAAKPKLLLVDDSMAIRQSLSQMMAEDYEVLQAGSGVAAIRAITLDKPDLVLLDYEMPVCDGRQTLEMMRSEKAFADVPVIFLTSRGDPESVRSVMALKPAGYLLKKFSPEKIKEKIDAFFQQQAVGKK